MSITLTAEGVAVLWELAGRPKSISMIANMIKLCSDEDLKDLLADLPIGMLEQLAYSKTKRERRVLVALTDLVVNTDLDLSGNGLGYVLAKNSNTPVEALQMLARSSNSQWRFSVASNRKTPTDILVLLSIDPEVKIRGAVGRHKNTPSDVLVTLAGDKYAKARGAALANPRLPREVLLATLPKKGTADAFNSLAYSSSDPEVLRCVAKYCSRDSWRLYNVARNENTPKDVAFNIYENFGRKAQAQSLII